jgi:hypothetical protein
MTIHPIQGANPCLSDLVVNKYNMEKIKKSIYKVLYAYNLEDLGKTVNEHLFDDWKLHKGLVVNMISPRVVGMSSITNELVKYYQIVVKEIEV